MQVLKIRFHLGRRAAPERREIHKLYQLVIPATVCPRTSSRLAEMVPERLAGPGVRLGEAQKGIAAVPPQIAARPGADLAASDLAADIVLRTIGMQRDFGRSSISNSFDCRAPNAIQCSAARRCPPRRTFRHIAGFPNRSTDIQDDVGSPVRIVRGFGRGSDPGFSVNAAIRPPSRPSSSDPRRRHAARPCHDLGAFMPTLACPTGTVRWICRGRFFRTENRSLQPRDLLTLLGICPLQRGRLFQQPGHQIYRLRR